MPATRSERWQPSRDGEAPLLRQDPGDLSGDLPLTAVKVQTIFALCGCRSQMHNSNTNIQRLNAVNSPSLTTTKRHIIMTKHLGLTGDQKCKSNLSGFNGAFPSPHHRPTIYKSHLSEYSQPESERGLDSTFLAKKQRANLFCATKACWGSPLCHCSNNNMWFGCTAPGYSGKRRGAKFISYSVV